MYSYEYIRQKTVVFKTERKGLIPFSRIDRKIYYKKEDILNYMKKNLKTHTNNGNGTDGIE